MQVFLYCLLYLYGYLNGAMYVYLCTVRAAKCNYMGIYMFSCYNKNHFTTSFFAVFLIICGVFVDGTYAVITTAISSDLVSLIHCTCITWHMQGHVLHMDYNLLISEKSSNHMPSI